MRLPSVLSLLLYTCICQALSPSPSSALRASTTQTAQWSLLSHRSARFSPAVCVEVPQRLDALRTLDTLITRTLDTVEDAWLLARRVAADVVDPIDCLDCWQDESDHRPRVLVIGSGWAAHALVKIVDADLYRR